MRVADRTTGRNYLKYLGTAQTNWSNTNLRLASGVRFNKISDDVSGGVQVLKVRTEKYKAEKQLNNVKNINEELKSTETAMDSVEKALIRVHEIARKAGTDSTAEGRKAIKDELEGIQKEILQYANHKYGNKYVFGGKSSATAPFTVDGSKVLYNGIDVNIITKNLTTGRYEYPDAGGNLIEVPRDEDMYLDIGLDFKMEGSDVLSDSALKVSYSGLDFMGVGRDADGLSNNIYNLMSDMIKSLDNGADDPMNSFDRETFEKVDTKLYKEVMDDFRSNLTSMGAKTNYLENMQSRLEGSVDSYATRIDTLCGINEEDESTTLAQNQATVKAILQIGSKILPLTLMDYIR